MNPEEAISLIRS